MTCREMSTIISIISCLRNLTFVDSPSFTKTKAVTTTELNRAIPIGHLMSPSWAILLEASGGDPRDVQPKGCDVTVLNYVRRRHTRDAAILANPCRIREHVTMIDWVCVPSTEWPPAATRRRMRYCWSVDYLALHI